MGYVVNLCSPHGLLFFDTFKKNVIFCSTSKKTIRRRRITAPVRSPRPTGQARIYIIFRKLNF